MAWITEAIGGFFDALLAALVAPIIAAIVAALTGQAGGL